MNHVLLEQFEAIANMAIAEAEGVECSFEEFIDGLAYVRDLLNDALQTAQDDAERQR